MFYRGGEIYACSLWQFVCCVTLTDWVQEGLRLGTLKWPQLGQKLTYQHVFRNSNPTCRFDLELMKWYGNPLVRQQIYAQSYIRWDISDLIWSLLWICGGPLVKQQRFSCWKDLFVWSRSWATSWCATAYISFWDLEILVPGKTSTTLFSRFLRSSTQNKLCLKCLPHSYPSYYISNLNVKFNILNG